jgi:hypothetical protein
MRAIYLDDALTQPPWASDSDAEQYAARKVPHERTKRVGRSMRPNSIEGLVQGMPLVFQREQAAGLSATFHFTFTGAESRQITVTIRDRELDVAEGRGSRFAGSEDHRRRAHLAAFSSPNGQCCRGRCCAGASRCTARRGCWVSSAVASRPNRSGGNAASNYRHEMEGRS